MGFVDLTKLLPLFILKKKKLVVFESCHRLCDIYGV